MGNPAQSIGVVSPSGKLLSAEGSTDVPTTCRGAVLHEVYLSAWSLRWAGRVARRERREVCSRSTGRTSRHSPRRGAAAAPHSPENKRETRLTDPPSSRSTRHRSRSSCLSSTVSTSGLCLDVNSKYKARHGRTHIWQIIDGSPHCEDPSSCLRRCNQRAVIAAVPKTNCAQSWRRRGRHSSSHPNPGLFASDHAAIPGGWRVQKLPSFSQAGSSQPDGRARPHPNPI